MKAFKMFKKDVSDTFSIYLSRNTIQGIMSEFENMGSNSVKNYDSEFLDEDGIIVNSYSNIDDSEEYSYTIGEKTIYTYPTCNSDSLVVIENNEFRTIKGYDGNIYRLIAEYFVVDEKIYSVFPNYRIKCDGTVEKIEGSAKENLFNLYTKERKQNTK